MTEQELQEIHAFADLVNAKADKLIREYEVKYEI
jgi:hypothetical protein|tara:strand:- start:4052 stop:4153 length:102 start_codon:yes stop_codon:yes gene_type:complete